MYVEWGSQDTMLNLMTTNLIIVRFIFRPYVLEWGSQDTLMNLMTTNLIIVRFTFMTMYVEWGSQDTMLNLMPTNLITEKSTIVRLGPIYVPQCYKHDVTAGHHAVSIDVVLIAQFSITNKTKQINKQINKTIYRSEKVSKLRHVKR